MPSTDLNTEKPLRTFPSSPRKIIPAHRQMVVTGTFATVGYVEVQRVSGKEDTSPVGWDQL